MFLFFLIYRLNEIVPSSQSIKQEIISPANQDWMNEWRQIWLMKRMKERFSYITIFGILNIPFSDSSTIVRKWCPSISNSDFLWKMTFQCTPTQLHNTASFKENFILPFTTKNTYISSNGIETTDTSILKKEKKLQHFSLKLTSNRVHWIIPVALCKTKFAAEGPRRFSS